MTVRILSIANNQTDSTKIDGLLDRVKYLNLQPNKIKNADNIFEFIKKYNPEVILWALKDESNNDDIFLKIKNVNNSCNIPLILILNIAEHHKYSLGGINYCLVWNEITPALLEKTIFNALDRHRIEATAKSRESELTWGLSTIQDLFQTIVDNTSVLVWMVDIEGNFTFLNRAWLNFTARTSATALQENWLDRIHPDDIAECKQTYQSALEKHTGFEIEYRLRRFDNEYRTILNTAVYRSNSQGDAGWLCFGLDITRRKKIEQQLIEQSRIDRVLAKIIKDIYSSSNIDLILQTGANEIDRFLLANRVFITKVTKNRRLNLLFESKLAAASSCEVLDKKLPLKEVIDNFELLSKGAIIARDDALSSTIINHNDTNFTLIPYPSLLIPIVCDRQLWGLICIEFDRAQKYWQKQEIRFLEQVSIHLGIAIKQWLLYQQLEQTNKKLAREVTIDELTKVANRRQFDRYISLEWKRCAREKHPLSLILCDIDFFKLYNDAYGHLLGDRCLKVVAQAIAKVIKRPADLVARYGGEEFAVILPNTDISGAKYLAEQIRAEVEALKITHFDSRVNDYVTLSIGVACCIPDRELNMALIEAADKGLYKAKESGRNRVCQFDLNELSNDFSV